MFSDTASKRRHARTRWPIHGTDLPLLVVALEEEAEQLGHAAFQ